MSIEANIVADSVSPQGLRLYDAFAPSSFDKTIYSQLFRLEFQQPPVTMPV